MNLLDSIDSPENLKELNRKELDSLAQEIREFIISTVSITGGHLAPCLGVVELTLALHKTFSTPVDKVVWDVGHQAYVHKILTGRRESFATLRQYGGISGFPRIAESEYDAFGAGHASTAISAALGLATARDLKGEAHHVLAVVGDGALTGGMAFEGLNNAGASRRNIIVVLNDNRMSISPNVGALSKYLTQIITNPLYNKIKNDLWMLTGKLPRGSRRIRHLIHRIEEGLKGMVVPGSLFERLGFRYFGPIDGHDIGRLLRVFREIRKLNGPILVHVITKKGKGFPLAEENATKFHGLGSFCRETGSTSEKKAPSYTEIFGKTMVELAEKDERIVGITAAMADGTGLIHLAKRFPDRFFDVGIAEPHAVTFAAGMALQGMKPVVAIYSTFLQRAIDQIIHDVALQQLPVVFALDRGGIVGDDGPTHHGCFDLSYLRFIPNLVVMVPKDENELRDMLFTALQHDGPIALRYPRGESMGLPLKNTFDTVPIGKSEIILEGKDLCFLSVGDGVDLAMRVAGRLAMNGISAGVINARFVKPIDRQMVEMVGKKYPRIFTLENNAVIGGFGSAVGEILSETEGLNITFRRLGIPDRFVPHGSVPELMKEIELDVDSLVRRVEATLAEGKKESAGRKTFRSKRKKQDGK